MLNRTRQSCLRWSGDPFWKSDSLQGFFSLADQAIVSGTSFLTSVIIARSGSRQTLGAFFLAWNVLIILQAIQGDLISSPYMIHSRRRSGSDADSYTGSVLVHQLLLAGAACFIIALGLCLFRYKSGPTLETFREEGVVFLAVLPFLLMRHFVRHLSYAQMRIGATTVVDISIAAIQLSGLALLGWMGLLNVSSAYIALGIACGIPTCYWLLAGRQSMRFDWRLVTKHWGENWAFGRWALASQLTGRATGYLLPWVLALTHGEASTGLLAACITIVNMGGTFITGVSNYLTPRAASAFAAGGVVELRKVLQRVAAVYGTVIGSFVIVLVLFGDQIAAFVYGPEFTGGGSIIRLLGVALLVNSLSITVGNGLWAISRPDANFLADFCALLTGVTILAATVYPLGAAGAALALCAGNVVGFAVRWKRLVTATRELRPEVACP